jgi:hypothetical protein
MTAPALHGSQTLGRKPHERARRRAISIDLPWVLVLVQAVALIVSGMIGLAAALFV